MDETQSLIKYFCFESYDDIVDKLSIAWNAFSDNDTLVKSICSRQWMNV